MSFLTISMSDWVPNLAVCFGSSGITLVVNRDEGKKASTASAFWPSQYDSDSNTHSRLVAVVYCSNVFGAVLGRFGRRFCGADLDTSILIRTLWSSAVAASRGAINPEERSGC